MKGLGELTIFLTFGPLLTLGSAYAISSQTIQLFSEDFFNFLIIGIPLGLLTTNILFINQFPDYKSDKLSGKNNLVVLLGKSLSRYVYFLILILSFISMFFVKPILIENIINFNLPAFYIIFSFYLFLDYIFFMVFLKIMIIEI